MRGFAREASKGLRTGLADPSAKAGKAAGGSIVDGIGQGITRSRGRFRSLAAGVGDIFVSGLTTAGIGAGVALAVGLQKGMQREAQTDRIAASFADPQTGAQMGRLAGELYNEAFGDSVADTGAALRRVFQTGLAGAGDVTDEEMKGVTRRVLTFTDVMEADLEKTTRAVSRMVKSGIADNTEDALDILTRGFQQGANQADDLLDTFAEYSTQFREIGLSADDATGLMVQGLRAGARDADVVADSLKELAIRAQDGSIASARGFELLGLNAEQMTAQFAQGGASARDAFGQILDQLNDLEDPVARNAAAVALFGTKAEDLQDALFSLDLDTAADQLGTTEGATDDLASAYDNAATRIESFKRRALERLTLFVGNTVIPGLERLAEVVGPVLSDAWASFQETIQRLDFSQFEGFADFLIEEALPAMLEGLVAFTAFMVDTVVPAIGDAVQFMGEQWEEHGPLVREILDGLIDAAASFANFMIDDAWPAVRDAIGFMAGKWDQHDDDVLAVLGAIEGAIVGLYNFMNDTAVPQIQRAIGFLTDKWREHEGDVKNVLDQIKTQLGNFRDFLETTAAPATRRAIDWMIEKWREWSPAVIDAVQRAWDSLWRFTEWLLGPLAALTRRGFDKAIQGIDWFSDEVVKFFKWAADAVERFIDTVKRIPSRISTDISVTGLSNIGRSISPRNIIRRFHTGGVFRTGGSEGMALLQDGEGVFTPDQMQALGAAASTTSAPASSVVVIDADNLDRALLEWLRRSVRIEGGGDVQLALGGAR